jgi:hypothetical protein
MISVLLYGRNDTHGYNLHRRAALSLNCLAEVLTDPDDELIFVDYNTPDELPTFIEAISDTLTDRCLTRLRALRVPAVIHAERFASRTHLPVAEPVARNVAARRGNPANRWLLSTNTDMIFVPLTDRSMSEVCRDLPDGFYGLPRFELPEWLWEGLPRSDALGALARIRRLGPMLSLDETASFHDWIRFDAPGDCQLMLREDFFSIDGFNEEMLLGWHVDANLSRRMVLHRGSIASLEEYFAGYHCNHDRTRTHYHGHRVANNFHRFFYSIDDAELLAQRATWGLAGVTVQELRLREDEVTDSAAALVEVIPSRPRSSADAIDTPFSLTYDSGHVLPFIADTLLLAPRDFTVGYIGGNGVLERLLAATVDRLGFLKPLLAAKLDDATAVDRIADTADVFIVDLGFDVSAVRGFLDASRHELAEVPPCLWSALPMLYRLADLERSHYERVKHPRPMALVNSSAVYWDWSALAQFECSSTTVHSRVRRATVKPAPDPDVRAKLERGHRLLRWYGRRAIGSEVVTIRRGQTADIANLQDYGGFGKGWAQPDETGIWTDGPRAELTIRRDGSHESSEVLSFGVSMVCVDADKSLSVTLLVDDEPVAAREFTHSAVFWCVRLPASPAVSGATQLTFIIDEPHSPVALGWTSDDRRQLGIHIRSLALGEVDHSVRLGESVVFAEGSNAERFLGDGWSVLEPTGVWTIGAHACLFLQLTDAASADVEVILDVAPFLTAGHPQLEVVVSAQEQPVGARVFRYGEDHPSLHFNLPGGLVDQEGRVVLDLRLRDPARPVDLGVGADRRRLGLHLKSLTIRKPTGSVTVTGPRLSVHHE